MNKLVSEPVLKMYEGEEVVSEALYGDLVKEVEIIDENISLIETKEGYRGHAQRSGLVDDRPKWRFHDPVTVGSIGALIYSKPKVQAPYFLRLSYGSKLSRVQEVNGWCEVELVTGERGWIQKGDLKIASEPTILSAKRFLGLPYIWGGCSSFGYDCSGFIQMLFKELGVLLPRDSYQQVNSQDLIEVDQKEAGDILFFGEEKITHVGLYIGNDEILHATPPSLRIEPLQFVKKPLLSIRRLKNPQFEATISPIWEKPNSWRDECPISLDELCSVSLNHYDFDGIVKKGEIIVHKKASLDIVEIFKELFTARYPIEKIHPIDRYLSDDLLSTSDNNTSAYCCRKITGQDKEWSLHSFGLAIDINPLLNPYEKGGNVVPPLGAAFLDRSLPIRGMIQENDPCHQAFTKRGWQWGGKWQTERGYVDYQHFYLN